MCCCCNQTRCCASYIANYLATDVLPSPNFAFTFRISQKKKTPRVSIKSDLQIKRFLLKFWHFPSPFSNATRQSAHKNREMETQPLTDLHIVSYEPDSV